MISTSAAFAAALSKSQVVVTLALAESVAGTETWEILDGSVTIDRTAAIRRRASVSLRSQGPAIDLYGKVLRLYRGLMLPGGPEYVPLGVFRASNQALSDDGTKLDAECYDLARTISLNRLTAPYPIAAGTNLTTAVRDLLLDRMPGLRHNLAPTGHTIPASLFDEQSDPWDAARGLASAEGFELFFDATGTAVLQEEPDPASSPIVWSFHEGPDSMLLGAPRHTTDEQTYSHIIVTGEQLADIPPVRAEALDTDPASPTYIDGPFGDVPYFYTSRMITTVEMAQKSADALLRRHNGLASQVDFSALVHPGLEAGDVVDIYRSKSGVSGRYSFNSITIPLSFSGAMTAQTRLRKEL